MFAEASGKPWAAPPWMLRLRWARACIPCNCVDIGCAYCTSASYFSLRGPWIQGGLESTIAGIIPVKIAVLFMDAIHSHGLPQFHYLGFGGFCALVRCRYLTLHLLLPSSLFGNLLRVLGQREVIPIITNLILRPEASYLPAM